MSDSDTCTCPNGQVGKPSMVRAGSGFLYEGPNGERGLRAHIEVTLQDGGTSQILMDAQEWADLIAQMTTEALKLGGHFRDAYEQRMRRQRHTFN